MTQRLLGLRAGLSQPAVSQLENGGGRPRPDALLRLAKIFGVDPSLLLRDVESLTDEERKELDL